MLKDWLVYLFLKWITKVCDWKKDLIKLLQSGPRAIASAMNLMKRAYDVNPNNAMVKNYLADHFFYRGDYAKVCDCSCDPVSWLIIAFIGSRDSNTGVSKHWCRKDQSWEFFSNCKSFAC